MEKVRKILAVIIIASSIYIMWYGVNSYKNSTELETLKTVYYSEAETIITETEPLFPEETTSTAIEETENIAEAAEELPSYASSKAVLPSLQPLVNMNPDTVGWLKVPGTKIDNVVCQTTDNEYYLHHAFNKEERNSGTLFADYRCDIQECDNIIIYGHKQADKSMFGTLTRYRDIKGFYEEHPIIEFSDLYDKYQYEVIAYFVCETEENRYTKKEDLFDYYNYVNFTDRHPRHEFIKRISELSEITVTDDITEDDKFLTLSTCSYEFKGARFVLVARKIQN